MNTLTLGSFVTVNDDLLVQRGARFLLPAQNVQVLWMLLSKNGKQVGFFMGHYCPLLAQGIVFLFSLSSRSNCISLGYVNI